jgi:hypothetical protein
MGETGLRLLLERIRQPGLPPRRVQVNTHLLERESVAPFNPARHLARSTAISDHGKDRSS